ncbi:MAG: DUF447 domain-containing protein [Promethearchaeota archaeon]
MNPLNLIPNYIYETIVSTYSAENKLPHTAPMGIISLDEQNLIISPYISTQTFKNIEKYQCAGINFIYDLEIFFESTFSNKKPKLPTDLFIKASSIDAPLLKNTEAFIEARVDEIQINGNRARILVEIVDWGFKQYPFHPINRGFNLVLESMIHTTRIIAFRNEPHKIIPLLEIIKQYRTLIKKVAPAGTYLEIMDKIQKIINEK